MLLLINPLELGAYLIGEYENDNGFIGIIFGESDKWSTPAPVIENQLEAKYGIQKFICAFSLSSYKRVAGALTC